MNYPLTSLNTVLLPQFQPWTDQYGMITNNPQGLPTDNDILFTAHYVYGLYSTNQMTSHENQRILQVLSNNFLQSGLMCRSPNFPGSREAQDDIFGLMAVEAQLSPNDRKMTKAIYDYGKISAKGIDSTEPYQGAQTRAFWAIKVLTLGRCRWVWNNIEPGKFDEASWLGRFLPLLAVMRMSLRIWVNPIYWIYWALTSLYSAWFGDQSGNNGDCLMLQGSLAAVGYGPLTNWVCRQIHLGIKRKYGSAGGLMSSYFQDPTNPLIGLLNSTDC